MAVTRTLVFCLLAAGTPAACQSPSGEFWPELDVFYQAGQILRFQFSEIVTSNPVTHDWLGNFTFYVEAALKPLFRQDLRARPDVYQNRYLTFRAGYRYRTSMTSGESVSENRVILDVTPRYLLPWRLVVVDRNRGEFRFIKGQPFATRYKNRLWIERDVDLGFMVITPYAYDEIAFDARYGQWTPNWYAFGVQLPVGGHVLWEPYYLRQVGSRTPPTHVNAFGLKLQLFF